MGDRSKVIARLAQQGGQLAEMRSRPPTEDGGVRCGSCSKGSGEVLAMFEGPSAFICNECVMLFAAEVAERGDGG